MKYFEPSLKHRLLFSLMVLLLFIAVLFYCVVSFGGELIVWFPVIIIIAYYLGYLLINYVYHPFSLLIESIETGLNCLRDNDLSVSLSKQKYSEFKNSINNYNELADILRKERMELHQRELLLDTVIQSTPMAIILTTANDVIVYSNVAARKLLNHPTRLDSLKFDSLLSHLPEELILATQKKREGLYNLYHGDTKKIYYLTFQEFNLNSQTHQLYLYKNMTSEVTKEELQIWKKVIRLISHELNNSLAPIQSLTNSAKKIVNKQSDNISGGNHKNDNHNNNDMLNDILETIDRRSKHLHHFIEKYAKFSRLPNPVIQEVNLSNFVTSLETICEMKFDKRIDCEHARFDSAQLEQVIINLIKNAKESGTELSDVELEMHITPKKLKIKVKDRGKGMTEEQLKQSLLPFFTTKSHGSGLGLALSNEIVNAHEGRLKLYNRHAGGLTVEIQIPIANK
jgi:two-component system nitrogen regulation sensor histidine kinase NtrY